MLAPTLSHKRPASPEQTRADVKIIVCDEHMEKENKENATFSVATRVSIYAIATLALTIGITPVSSLALSLTLILLLGLSGKRSMAIGFGITYLILFAIYFGMFIAGLHFFIFSPPTILQIVGKMPAMVGLFLIVTAPPGLISSALAKIHMPKKIIVGVLVIVRFFPTVGSFWKKYRDAVRTRGLLTFTSVISNPMNAFEYVVVPVILSLATSADQLSTSAIARAAEAPTRRSSYYHQRLTVVDFLALSVVTVVCAGCVWWTKMGWL